MKRKTIALTSTLMITALLFGSTVFASGNEAEKITDISIISNIELPVSHYLSFPIVLRTLGEEEGGSGGG